MSRFRSISSAVLLGVFVILPAYAADCPSGTRECGSIAWDPDRLACYDRIFAAPENPPGATDEVKAAAVAEARRDFGLSEADKRARDPESAKDRLPESMEATVAEVSRHARGNLIIALDNGQVWMQSEAVTHARVQAGDVVTIRKAALGSFQLVTPGRVAVRVRRVQ